jgi:hypothetical protein
VAELGDKLEQLFIILGSLLADLGRFALTWLLVIVWLALALWGVNWQRAWPVLARGGWVPLVLLMVLAALVWSELAPMEGASFWPHLGGVCLVVAVTLFCGWLQGYFGWTPPTVELEPPAPADDTHGHEHPVGTFHGHEYAHSDEPH